MSERRKLIVHNVTAMYLNFDLCGGVPDLRQRILPENNYFVCSTNHSPTSATSKEQTCNCSM